MMAIGKKIVKSMQSVRAQLTLLMVALLVCCCVILTWLVYRSTAQLLEVAAANSLRQGNLSIVLDVAGIERSILLDALFILILVVIGGSCAAYFLAGHYTKPIKQLSARMREIGPDSLSHPIEVDGGGEEIQELVKSFNQMTDQLGEAFAMQSRFSVSAAHELRTPLAVLRTRLDVFKKKQREQAEYDELIGTMETYVGRLSSIISSLLELTETGKLPDAENVSLDSVIETVVTDLKPVAYESAVEIRFDARPCLDAQPLEVRGNADLLYRALYNLVENAIRYNHEGGAVSIDLAAQGEKVVVKVSDTGVGIDPEARELIFEPFYRVNKSRSREFGGAGIGLSLVKAILKRHDAHIAVDENKPQGTVFTVTFPKVEATDTVEAATVETADGVTVVTVEATADEAAGETGETNASAKADTEAGTNASTEADTEATTDTAATANTEAKTNAEATDSEAPNKVPE